MQSDLVPTQTDLDMITCFLGDKGIYADLVESTPDINAVTKGNCLIAGGGNYSSLPLSGITVSGTANGGAQLTADPIAWLGLITDGTPLVGCSFFLQGSVNPSSSDRLIATISFLDSAGLQKEIIPDGTDFRLPLDTLPILVTRHGS